MQNSIPKSQEGNDRPPIEDIHNTNHIPLGKWVTYELCDSSSREGEAVDVNVFRPAGDVLFQVNCVVCGDEVHELPEEYTLGVRELVSGGLVGWCTDWTTQSSWPVWLDPEMVAVSVAATESVRKNPDGGLPSNVASDVKESVTPVASAKDSLGVARRHAGRPDVDVVLGFLWGGER